MYYIIQLRIFLVAPHKLRNFDGPLVKCGITEFHREMCCLTHKKTLIMDYKYQEPRFLLAGNAIARRLTEL